jgi:hypothetical protein
LKTTELYIEQVLIGSLIIAVFALPWIHQLSPELTNSLPKLIAEASLLLGVGFWIGIPFDRFADTLLDRLERHNRLQFALKNSIGKELIKQENSVKLTNDIYPEDRHRLKGWRAEEGIVNWLEYNRSRIRLARALAVYGPALTFSLTVAVSRDLYGKPGGTKCVWLSLVTVLYFAWAMLASPPAPLQPSKSNRRIIHAVFGEKLPRTDDVELIEYGHKWDRVIKKKESESTYLVQKSSHSDLFVWVSEWRVVAIPLLLLIATIWVGFRHGFPANWVAWAGASLTVIASWSWWRISYTYRTYLKELEPYDASSPPNV